YRDPERMNFGALRVLNDDRVAPGMGFNTHPHDNMEIITIPLEGDLEHKDSMGNHSVIRQGDVQVMSAGTGIFHSEFNHNRDREVKLLQIWLFPNQKNVEPRYDQVSIRDLARKDAFFQVLSPREDEPGVWIYQDAWFHMGEFSAGSQAEYAMKNPASGVYFFLIEGQAEVAGHPMGKRDGLGIRENGTIGYRSVTESRVLLMEVPMFL
ncbi:MAG: pirin family protein, partial [Bacteroidetes bacterium]